MTTATVRHPARFTGAILDVLAELVPPGSLVLDPFCGTGRVHELAGAGIRTVGSELGARVRIGQQGRSDDRTR